MVYCVFIHSGYNDYLDSVFAITRKFNTNNKIILLGDDKNKEVAKKYDIDFHELSDYNQEIPYHHFSTNAFGYEKFCFERWFILNNFCLKNNISEVLYSDSDNAFFVDFNTLDYHNARIGRSSDFVVPNVFFVSGECLEKICKYYLELYSLPIEQFVNEIQDFAYKEDNTIKLYTDMYFLQQSIHKLNLDFKTLPEHDESQIFNGNVRNYEFSINGSKVYKKNTESQLINLHFQGDKKYIATEILNRLIDNDKMFEFVDKIIYINLAKRTDRKERLLSDLLKVCPKDKIIRFDAIHHNPGWIGCAKSHIAALEIAQKNNWKNVLILEDDAILNSPAKVNIGYENLQKIVSGHWDGICLGLLNSVYDQNTMRISQSLSTVAYMVNNHYYSVIIDNFKEALAKLEETREYSNYAIDQWWWKIMKRDNWFGTNPSVFIQSKTYSDISSEIYHATDDYL